MTQEDKQLLLITLCGMLPYGVNLHIEFYDLQGDGKLANRDIKLTPGNIAYCFDNSHWVSVKPYLRLMSSMTEEEKDELNNLFNGTFQYFNQRVISAEWDNNEAVFVGELDCSKLIDWLNAHHFDYRGLIEKGLALEAPGGMYKQ
jgi:hypothetical protein